jgi:hypothetical protein
VKARVLILVLLLGLVACAAHAPRCRDRLTPINGHLQPKAVRS